ncbi:MAG: DUF1858 domain-containing protein [Planctomycetota bacterium]
MSKKFAFTGETRIEDALMKGARVLETFRRLGLKCEECAAAGAEDLRTAALYHEKPLDEILEALNDLGIKSNK